MLIYLEKIKMGVRKGLSGGGEGRGVLGYGGGKMWK